MGIKGSDVLMIKLSFSKERKLKKRLIWLLLYELGMLKCHDRLTKHCTTKYQSNPISER